MSEPSINERAEIYFRLAVNKGWWEGCEPLSPVEPENPYILMRHAVLGKVAEKLNLIHDETSEASAEARRDRWGLYWIVEFPDGSRRILLSELEPLIALAMGEKEKGPASEVLREICQAADLASCDPGKDLYHSLVYALSRKFKPEGFIVEIADTIIRALELTHAVNEDIARAMELKHTYNQGRPYRHGHKRY